jgi:hypothetical protein
LSDNVLKVQIRWLSRTQASGRTAGMNWLLDTNVVFELTRENPAAAVLAWLKERRGQCFLSTITLAEFHPVVRTRSTASPFTPSPFLSRFSF